MTKAADGGPAFPTGTTTYGSKRGMSLRDWFAGQILAGMLAHSPWYKPRQGAQDQCKCFEKQVIWILRPADPKPDALPDCAILRVNGVTGGN